MLKPNRLAPADQPSCRIAPTVSVPLVTRVVLVLTAGGSARQTVVQLIPKALLAAAYSSGVSSATVGQASAAVASRRRARLTCLVDQGVDASVPCLDELDAQPAELAVGRGVPRQVLLLQTQPQKAVVDVHRFLAGKRLLESSDWSTGLSCAVGVNTLSLLVGLVVLSLLI